MKSIIEHEEMKGHFGSVSEDFKQRFKLMYLDMSDFPKLHSPKSQTIHIITEGEEIYFGKIQRRNTKSNFRR